MPEEKMAQRFEDTPEAYEYVERLQDGKVTLPTGAGPLEYELLGRLKAVKTQIREILTRHNDLEKQIEALIAQKNVAARDIDVLRGEASGYSKVLASAKGVRRQPKMGDSGNGTEPPDGQKQAKKDADPVERREEKSAAKADEPAAN